MINFVKYKLSQICTVRKQRLISDATPQSSPKGFLSGLSWGVVRNVLQNKKTKGQIA